jgi:hypothetical protein
MAHECPEAYQSICRLLSLYEVQLTVESETVAIHFQPDRAQVLHIPQQPTVFFASTKTAILDLIDAKFTLEHAILHDLIHVRGAMRDVIVFYDALRLYIHGAVRCPSFPKLLSDYRYRTNGKV